MRRKPSEATLARVRQRHSDLLARKQASDKAYTDAAWRLEQALHDFKRACADKAADSRRLMAAQGLLNGEEVLTAHHGAERILSIAAHQYNTLWRDKPIDDLRSQILRDAYLAEVAGV